jgi:uncharacterized protein (DUF1330 family)
MKQSAAIVVALLVGIAIGAGAIPALMAQTARHPAYVIAELHVTDPAGFTDYAKKVPATLVPYHGRIIVRALPDTREGDPPDGQIMIVAFDSLQDANHWYSAPPYSDLIPARQKAANSRVYIVDGLPQ